MKTSFSFPSTDLISWFQEHKRDLPWRKKVSPYHIWISEVMLQQTQVSTVIDYYTRWIERFPDVTSLAQASLEEVMKMWEGLGYYSRVRALHRAAQYIVTHHNAIFPNTREVLLAIPGIGPYTCGAILSFAFHQKAPLVDANVKRVFARFFGIEEATYSVGFDKQVWELAEAALPETAPWIHNEALMELGALVCQKKPHCLQCPLQSTCFAFQHKRTADLPKLAKKQPSLSIYRQVHIVHCEGAFLIAKNENVGKLMHGLCEFPSIEIQDSTSFLPLDSSLQALLLELKSSQPLKPVQHSFTRYRAALFPYFCEVTQKTPVSGYFWVSKDQLKKYTFNSGHKKILHQIENK